MKLTPTLNSKVPFAVPTTVPKTTSYMKTPTTTFPTPTRNVHVKIPTPLPVTQLHSTKVLHMLTKIPDLHKNTTKEVLVEATVPQNMAENKSVDFEVNSETAIVGLNDTLENKAEVANVSNNSLTKDLSIFSEALGVLKQDASGLNSLVFNKSNGNNTNLPGAFVGFFGNSVSGVVN